MSAIDNLLVNTAPKMPFDQQTSHPMTLPNPSSSKYSVSPPSPPSTASNASTPQPTYLQQSSSYKQVTPLKVSLPPITELLKESSISTPKAHSASIMTMTPSGQSSTAGSTTASSITAPTTSANTPSPSPTASHVHTPQQLSHQLPQQQPQPQQQVLQPLITQQLLHQQFGPQDQTYQPVYSHQSMQYQQPGRVSPTVLTAAYPHQQQVPQGAQLSSFYNPNTGRYEQTIVHAGQTQHPAHSVSVHQVHQHPGHAVHQGQHPSAGGPILLDEKVANQQMRKKRQNLPRQTTLVLLSWLSDHLDRPYPNSREKYELLLKTRLTIQQLDNWFINARRRKINVLKKLKENDQSISLTF